MRTIVIAPDKFKGSLTAKQVCESVEKALNLIDSDLSIISIPLADGGEGTADILTEYSHGSFINVTVLNPLLNAIPSQYGVSQDGKTAFIEMAKASGLLLLDPVDRNPLLTSTFGTGQLIRHAMENGVNHIVLGIGGSATNDAGMGLADALGFSFLSSSGERLKPIGENLIHITGIDHQLVHPLISQTRFTVLCDVDNTLHGKNGAAYVFAPQKGASPSDVVRLDEGLKNFENVVASILNTTVDFEGAGAAGGLGAGARVFLKATMINGFDFISRFTHLAESIQRADLIITGEGKIDQQTLSGKVVKGVADLAAKYQKPCVAFAGKCDLPAELASALRIIKIVTLVNENTSDTESVADAFSILQNRAFTHLGSLISSL
ncbi:glycerate 3-kinase [soil metagenome]